MQAKEWYYDGSQRKTALIIFTDMTAGLSCCDILCKKMRRISRFYGICMAQTFTLKWIQEKPTKQNPEWTEPPQKVILSPCVDIWRIWASKCWGSNLHSLQLTAKATENRSGPQKEMHLNQPLILRGKLNGFVSGRVSTLDQPAEH